MESLSKTLRIISLAPKFPAAIVFEKGHGAGDAVVEAL
jgi:hypothetical protein